MKKSRFFLAVISLFVAITSSAQNISVTGVVTDASTGEPIPFAFCQVKGSTKGSSSDADGRYSIPVPSDGTIIFSSMGYEQKEVAVKGKTTINVALTPDSQLLEGVVVTGMQKMDRRLFTGSTAKLDAESAKIDGLTDVSRSLEGRVAGVSVQNVSGTFGTAPKIRVRGATSIYGSSKPLWVVDGVIMEDVVDVSADQLSSGDASTLISSAIAGLNSDDIESFDILKDGSATSIYGARAMAGVIVVTTKKGRAGSFRLNYTGEFTTRLKPSYRTFNIMNSQDQMEIYQELQQKGYLNYASLANASDSGVYGKMYQLIGQYDKTSGQFGLANTAAARAEYLRAAEYRNTDWFDTLFSNALQSNHSLSASGGSENATYYASLSVMQDPGWTKQSSVSRYTGNLNTTFKFSDIFTFNLISNASFRKQRAPGTLGQTMDVVSGEVKRDFDINPYSYALNTSRALDANEYYTRNYAPFNIMHELDNNYIDLGVTDIRIQGELKAKPFKQLELSALGAVKYTTSSQEHNILDESNQSLAYRAMDTATIRDNNPFLYKDPDNPYALPISVLPKGGIYERTDNSLLGWDFRATANYSETFAEKHIVNLFGGTEINSTERHGTWFRAWGIQYGMGETPNYNYNVFKKGNEENSDYYTMTNTHVRSAAFFANGYAALFTAFFANGYAALFANGNPALFPEQFRFPLTNLPGHIHSPPFFILIRFFHRCFDLVDQFHFALLHRIRAWIVDVLQHLPQRGANFPFRARRVEKQFIRFVLQFLARLPAHVAERVLVPRLAERIERADEDHVARPQFIEILPALQLVDVDMRLIQPRALRQRAILRGLHLNVVDGLAVVQIRVQPYAALIDCAQ